MPYTETNNNLKPQFSRAEIIRTVQTPLGFFVLVVLVVEVVFGIIVGFSEGTDRTYLIIGMLTLIFLLGGIVAFLAILRPESLQGVRPNRAPPVQSPVTSEVLRIEKPKVLCASTTQFEDIGFEKDIEILQRFFRKPHVEHNVTSGRLRNLLSEHRFDIIHLLSFVEPKDGTLTLAPDDQLASEGFANLIEVCGTELIVLATCDSIDLASKVSRKTNIIAATTTMGTDDFIQWAECFYNLLSRGHSLSRAYDIARTTTSAPMVLLMKHDVTFS